MTETKALYTEREGGRPDKRVFLGLNAQWRSWSGMVSRPIRPFIHSFVHSSPLARRAAVPQRSRAERRGPCWWGADPARRGHDGEMMLLCGRKVTVPGFAASVSVFTQAWNSGIRESEPAGDPVCRGQQPVTARGGRASALTDAGFPRR